MQKSFGQVVKNQKRKTKKMEFLINYAWVVLVGLMAYGLYLVESLPKTSKHHDNKRGSHYFESNKREN